jgi:hypothetical protein
MQEVQADQAQQALLHFLAELVEQIQIQLEEEVGVILAHGLAAAAVHQVVV